MTGMKCRDLFIPNNIFSSAPPMDMDNTMKVKGQLPAIFQQDKCPRISQILTHIIPEYLRYRQILPQNTSDIDMYYPRKSQMLTGT